MTRHKAVAALQKHRKHIAGELARVDAAIAALNGRTHSVNHTMSGRRMSAEARARIAAAQRKRWKLVKAKAKSNG